MARASRLAPYALRLRCAEPSGAWPARNTSCSAATSPLSACSARDTSSKGAHPKRGVITSAHLRVPSPAAQGGADSGHLRLSSERSSSTAPPSRLAPPPPPRSLLSSLQRERAQRSLRTRSQGVVRSHRSRILPQPGPQPPHNRTRPIRGSGLAAVPADPPLAARRSGRQSHGRPGRVVLLPDREPLVSP